MSYNVENLFDTKHDRVNNIDKNDWTFLPKNTAGKNDGCMNEKSKNRQKECLTSDWTEKKLELRLSQLSHVITKDHSLPDFLGVVEIENENVASRLAKKLGYHKFEMTNSPDRRGVDVALFYKNTKDIKKISKTEHVVPVEYETRNILEVEFLIAGKYPLTLFVNHWPSLSNPDSWRVKAAEVLSRRTREILAKNINMAIIALGDFNTSDDNNPHPFKTILFKENLFTDIGVKFSHKKMSPGTYYFAPKKEWNDLDHFFVNKILLDKNNLELIPNSFEIYSPEFISKMIKVKKNIGEQQHLNFVFVPKRFNLKGKSKESIGFSDHFPILMKLKYP